MKSKRRPHEETDDAILDGAITLLLTHGSDAVSMEMIAEEAGVSRRTVFNRFASKDGVFAAAMNRVWSRIPMLEITSRDNALDHPAETLREVALAIVQFWLPQRAIDTARMVIRESTRYPQLSETYINTGKRPTLDALIAYMTQLTENGVADIADADLAARQFVGLINEPLVFYRVLGLRDAPSLEHAHYVADEAVRTFLSRYPLNAHFPRPPQSDARD